MSILCPFTTSVEAFAPATCSNVAVGFDILGFALDQVGDHVRLTKRHDKNFVIMQIDSADDLPLDIEKNTASLVVKKICQSLDIPVGFDIVIRKGIAVGSGMGGSAASAVAALVALNGFLLQPVAINVLIQYALLGEEVSSGQQHPDNVVPSLYGGFTLIQSMNPVEVIQLPIPDVYCVMVHPHLCVETKHARNILKETVLLKDYVRQSANLAAFITALYNKDNRLIEKTLTDILVEPQRAALVPCFYQVKNAVMEAGAMGVSFSGSGPSMFAFANSNLAAERISDVMKNKFKEHAINADTWVCRISDVGAHVVDQIKDV